MPKRDTSVDRFGDKLLFFVLTSFGPIWRLVNRVKCCHRRTNRTLVNAMMKKMPSRPEPWSCCHDYVSWEGLSNRSFWKRHLPPSDEMQHVLPSLERVAELFRRPPDSARLQSKSTLLFSHFASWFTDGILRSERREPRDIRCNASSHEIDLNQLYGVNAKDTAMIRLGNGGQLKSQVINGEEFPPFLCSDGKIKPEFEKLPLPTGWKMIPDTLKDGLFAFAMDRANFHPHYAMFTVLFFREHNRVAKLLQSANPTWDDERLFQTTRMILIVCEINIVVEEYINHIGPYHFKFTNDPAILTGKEDWYRPNWGTIEFNLLYRWHSLVPSRIRVRDSDVSLAESMFQTGWLPKHGLGQLFEDASLQRATKFGLYNTDSILQHVEVATIKLCREARVRSYNDYREFLGLKRVTDFNQITGDPVVINGLKSAYGHVDNVEFYVGLNAEEVRPNSVLGTSAARMVAVDAFSQIYTNPLLSKHVYNETTFTKLGMQMIQETRTIQAILDRNVPDRGRPWLATLTHPQWFRNAPDPECELEPPSLDTSGTPLLSAGGLP